MRRRAKRFPRCGEVWIAGLDPVVGAEIGKSRPVLVVSNDQNNRFSDTVTVLPVTSQPPKRKYLYEVIVPQGIAGLVLQSRIKANQVRTISKQRLVRFLGILPARFHPEVVEALKIHLNMF